jgi:hypothetical protein
MAEPPPLDAAVELAIDLPSSATPLVAFGRVRSRPSGGGKPVCVELTPLSEAQRAAVAEALRALERASAEPAPPSQRAPLPALLQ